MKKAKIFLVVIVIFALISGAFAYKTRQVFKFYTAAEDGQCTITTVTFYSTTPCSDPNAVSVPLWTTATTAPCPGICVKSIL
jgi:hypothetical protein